MATYDLDAPVAAPAAPAEPAIRRHTLKKGRAAKATPTPAARYDLDKTPAQQPAGAAPPDFSLGQTARDVGQQFSQMYHHPGQAAMGLIPGASEAYQSYELGQKPGEIAKAGWQGFKEQIAPYAAAAGTEVALSPFVGPLAAAPVAGAAYGAIQNLEQPYFHPGTQADPNQLAASMITGGVIGGGLGLAGRGVHALRGKPEVPAGGEPPVPPGGAGGGTPPAGPAGSPVAPKPVPGQPPVAEAAVPRGGPGQPPVTPATPPENATLNTPAVRWKGKIFTGSRPGMTHDQIKLERGIKGRADHGFIDDAGQFKTRPQARAEIKAKTGVDVGRGSPTSEQLEAEQGLRPPKEGTPATPQGAQPKLAPEGGLGNSEHTIITIRDRTKNNAVVGQHLVTRKGLQRYLDQLSKSPNLGYEMRDAGPTDIATIMKLRAGAQQQMNVQPPPVVPGQPTAQPPTFGSKILEDFDKKYPQSSAAIPQPPRQAAAPTVEPYKEQVPENAEQYNLTPEKFRALAEDPSLSRADRRAARYLEKSLKKHIEESRGREPVEASKGLPKIEDFTAPGEAPAAEPPTPQAGASDRAKILAGVEARASEPAQPIDKASVDARIGEINKKMKDYRWALRKLDSEEGNYTSAKGGPEAFEQDRGTLLTRLKQLKDRRDSLESIREVPTKAEGPDAFTGKTGYVVNRLQREAQAAAAAGDDRTAQAKLAELNRITGGRKVPQLPPEQRPSEFPALEPEAPEMAAPPEEDMRAGYEPPGELNAPAMEAAPPPPAAQPPPAPSRPTANVPPVEASSTQYYKVTVMRKGRPPVERVVDADTLEELQQKKVSHPEIALRIEPATAPAAPVAPPRPEPFAPPVTTEAPRPPSGPRSGSKAAAALSKPQVTAPAELGLGRPAAVDVMPPAPTAAAAEPTFEERLQAAADKRGADAPRLIEDSNRYFAKAQELLGRGDHNGASKYFQAARKFRERAAAITQPDRVAKGPGPVTHREWIDMARSLANRGDAAGAAEALEKARRVQMGVSTTAPIVPNAEHLRIQEKIAEEQQRHTPEVTEAPVGTPNVLSGEGIVRAGAGAPVTPEAAPPEPRPQPQMPEVARMGERAKAADVRPGEPIAHEKMTEEVGVPAKVRKGAPDGPAIKHEPSGRVIDASMGRTYEEFSKRAAADPLQWTKGEIRAGKFKPSKGPTEPVAPAPSEAPKDETAKFLAEGKAQAESEQARAEEDLAKATERRKAAEDEYRKKFRASLESRAEEQEARGAPVGSLDWIADELAKQKRDEARRLGYREDYNRRQELERAGKIGDSALKVKADIAKRQIARADAGETSNVIPADVQKVLADVHFGRLDEEMAGRLLHSKTGKGPYDLLSSNAIQRILHEAQAGDPKGQFKPFNAGQLLQEWDRSAGHEPNMRDALKTVLKGKPRGSFTNPQAIVKAGEMIDAGLDTLRTWLTPTSRALFKGDISAERGGQLFRQGLGNADKLAYQASRMLQGVRNAMLRLTPDEQIDFMDRINKGQAQANPALDKLAKPFQEMHDARQIQISDLSKEIGVPMDRILRFKEHYFPRMFASEKQGREALANWRMQRRLTGRAGFKQHQNFPDLVDAIQAAKQKGLKLVAQNPVDLWEHNEYEFQKYANGLRAWNKLKQEDYIRFYRHPSDVPSAGWVKAPNELAEVFYRNAQGERVKAGDYYMPEPLARVLQNHLSPSMWSQNWYRTFRHASNSAVTLELGLSGFHTFMTAVNSAATEAELGIRQVLGGYPVRGAGRILRTPLAVAKYGFEGAQMSRRFKLSGYGDPVEPAMQSYFDAGGKFRVDKEYTNGHWRALKDAIRSGDYKNKPISTVARVPLAAIELVGKPLFEKLIPWVKMGAAKEMMSHELRGIDPVLDNVEYLRRVGGIVDSMDNRFGMIHYDNLFWNKSMQNAVHALVRAPGWYLGNYRELGGGIYDLLKGKPSRRTAFLLAQTAIIPIVGTLYQYALTGTVPKVEKDAWTTWRNFMHPETGRTNVRGEKERLQFPSYNKDVEDFTYAMSGPPGSMASYGGSKLNPLWPALASMVSGVDWKNTRIRNPNDPYSKQALDTLKSVGREYGTPIGVQNIMRRQELAGVAGDLPAGSAANEHSWLETFMGLTVPKQRWMSTPFRNALYEDHLRKIPRGPYTQEEISTRKAINELSSYARREKDPEKIKQAFMNYYVQGKLGDDREKAMSKFKEVVNNATVDPLTRDLKGASLETVLGNYSKVGPAEMDEVNIWAALKLIKMRAAGGNVLPNQQKTAQHILLEFRKLEKTNPDRVEQIGAELAR